MIVYTYVLCIVSPGKGNLRDKVSDKFVETFSGDVWRLLKDRIYYIVDTILYLVHTHIHTKLFPMGNSCILETRGSIIAMVWNLYNFRYIDSLVTVIKLIALREYETASTCCEYSSILHSIVISIIYLSYNAVFFYTHYELNL